MHLIQPFTEIFQYFRNIDVLRTYFLTAVTADAGTWFFIRRKSADHHGCDKASVTETVLVIER